MKYALGVDIGGTKLAVTLARAEREYVEILRKLKFPTPHEGGWQLALEQLSAACWKLLEEEKLDVKSLCGIGISCGGPLDSQNGVILSPPHLIGWNAVPIVQYFEDQFGIPAHLQNDANACALAEWKYGAGRGCRNVIFLTFGTGFGAGLILDGKLYSGTNDMAGEIGHIRAPFMDVTRYTSVGFGKSGSFDGYCSGGGIAQLGRMAALEQLQMGRTVSFCGSREELDTITAKTIADAAEAGDPLALSVYQCSGRYLGGALSMLVDLLNPEVIIIGSIYVRSTELLRESAFEVMEREALSHSRSVCKVVPAELNEHLGDYAALSIAFNAAE